VRQLEQHPLDSEAREKLALIYADHYQRLDLAVDQLEQLIQQPNQPQRQVTRWLNLLADLQIKRAHDLDAAKRSLDRVIEMFPGSASAEQARLRLAHLKLELAARKRHRGEAGTYEQNLGCRKPSATLSATTPKKRNLPRADRPAVAREEGEDQT